MTIALARPLAPAPLFNTTQLSPSRLAPCSAPAPPAEHATPQSPCDITSLIPTLAPHTDSARPALNDDGYFDSAVSVGLCRGIDMILRTRSGRSVTQRALVRANLSTHTAWAAAAQNVLRSALTPRGYHFRTREELGGLRVDTPGADPATWLAHPLTFSVFHRHLARLMGTNDLIYLAPTMDAVWVLRAADARTCSMESIFTKAAACAQSTTLRAATRPLIWSHGFPRPV